MIIINPQIKDKKQAYQNHINFPHLFAKYEGEYGGDADEYYLSSKFWWDFDKDYNLVVETILDGEQLQNEVLRVLNKQKEFAEIIIEKEQKKLASINEILKGVQNG